jgi:hypothetical protein
MTDQLPYWIALSTVPGIGPARMRKLLDYFGNAEEAWGATCAGLLEAGLDTKTTEALTTARRDADLDTEITARKCAISPAKPIWHLRRFLRTASMCSQVARTGRHACGTLRPARRCAHSPTLSL